VKRTDSIIEEADKGSNSEEFNLSGFLIHADQKKGEMGKEEI